MPSASGIRAGQAFVEIFANDKRLIQGLNAASKRLKAWGQSISSLGQKMLLGGLAAGGGLFGASQVFAATGDVLQKMSQRTGISVEALSELGYAAEQSGASLEVVEASVRTMQKRLAEAQAGSTAVEETFNAIGLSLEQLANLKPDEQFELIADRLAQIEDPAQRTAAAMQIFGKSGAQLLPLISGGAQGIQELRNRARQLGLTISTEDADAAAAFGDAMSDLWKTMRQGIFYIGAAVAPVLQNLAENLSQVARAVADWLNRNRELIRMITIVTGIVIGAGAAITAFGYAVSAAGMLLEGLATAVSIASSVIGALVGVIGFIATPVGAAVAALASLAGYLIYTSGVGGKALRWLGDQFNALEEWAIATWQGIADAIAAGDLQLAVKIAWLAIKLEWQRGISALKTWWRGFTGFFVDWSTNAFYDVAEVVAWAYYNIKKGGSEAFAFVCDAFLAGIQVMARVWRALAVALIKGWMQLIGIFNGLTDLMVKQIESVLETLETSVEASIAQKRKEVEEARKARAKEIEEQQTGTLGILEEERTNELKKNAEARQNAREKELEDIEKTEKEWREALAEAARKRAELKPTEALPGAKELPEIEEPELPSMEVAKKRATFGTAAGTFSAFAARGLGLGGSLEKIRAATEATAKNTQRILDAVEEGGVFV